MEWREWHTPVLAGLFVAVTMFIVPVGMAICNVMHAPDDRWNDVLVQVIRAGRVCSPMECDQ